MNDVDPREFAREIIGQAIGLRDSKKRELLENRIVATLERLIHFRDEACVLVKKMEGGGSVVICDGHMSGPDGRCTRCGVEMPSASKVLAGQIDELATEGIRIVKQCFGDDRGLSLQFVSIRERARAIESVKK